MDVDRAIEEPKDKWNSIWLLCVLLGVGQLFPWNAYITAYDYYVYLFATFPTMFVLPIINSWAQGLVMFTLPAYERKITRTIRLRVIYTCYFVRFLCLIIVPTVNLTDWSWDIRLGIVLLTSGITGLSTALLIALSFSLVGNLPPIYRGALMAGHGVAGVGISVLKLCLNFWWFNNSISSSSVISSGIIYFGLASIVMIYCSIATYALTHSDFYLFYETHDISMNDDEKDVSSNENQSLIISEEYSQQVTCCGVWKKIFPDALNVFITLLITLSLFPGYTTRMRNYDETLSNENFGVILLNLFQFFDFIGRISHRFVLYPKKKYLWIPVWSRLIFYPLVMLSVYSDYFSNNAIAYTVMILFSLSNGYLTTLGMIYGPTRVQRHENETAGVLMGFSLQVGVIAGLHIAMILLASIEGVDSLFG
eukprot:TRINITY_DN7644_c0_g1_i1.p1 TRINITY_DN7644_c0_g1~~TRINITY_DN7644_c0_g1_i1.p1  ORF type:complete len:422 (+),score=30.47 TRINITY_DN7644_c0_g1_i1:29-1294(+)